MVQEQIETRGVRDPRVLEAMRTVPRHLFVGAEWISQAHADCPLAIGHGQTISQPSLVAFMTEALGIRDSDDVLEVGTGSGYQAAILAGLAKRVHSVELVEPLAVQAADRLLRLGYTNVTVVVGDGYAGWREAAPYAAVCVTASAPYVPPALVDQLAEGGRMVIPVGEDLLLVTKDEHGEASERWLMAVAFVPLVHGRESSVARGM